MSRKKSRNRSSGNTATATRGRESSVRMLREQVEENDLKIQDHRQRAILGAMATIAVAKTSAKIGRALESAYDYASNIVDPRDYLGDEYGVPSLIYPNSVPSAIWHREEGRLYPVFINEWDLRPIRGMGFTIGTFHPLGVGVLSKLTNYTIGKGIDPNITPDKRFGENEEIKQAAIIAQGIIDDFIEINRVHGDADREVFMRKHRDGDGGISLWHEGNGRVALRFVEPDQITQPGPEHEILDSMEYDGPPSNMLFGIHTDNGDTNAVHGYYVQWTASGQDWDYLPGGNIPFHSFNPACATGSQDTWCEFFKANTDRNVKRGFTDFFSVEYFLRLQSKVIGNAGEGAAIQAAIAFIRQHAPGITTGQIDNFQLGLATDQINVGTPLGTTTRQASKFFPGTILDIPQGQAYLNGPMGNQKSQDYVAVADAMARVAATRWDMPEWMLNGDASGTNRASSFVAESPFVKKTEVEQEAESSFWTRILWRVLAFNHQAGKFGDMPWQTVRRCLHMEVKGAQINVREPEKETARRLILSQAGILSDKQWAQEEGYDLEQQQKDGAKKQAAEGGAGGKRGVAGVPPGLLGSSDTGGESAASPLAEAERRLESGADPTQVLDDMFKRAEDRLQKIFDQMESAVRPAAAPNDLPPKSLESAEDDFIASEEVEYGPDGKPLPKFRPGRYTDPDAIHYHGPADEAADGKGWIGVDLDSTLVHSPNGHFEPGKIGPPVPAMVEKVRKALADGQELRIFTARVASTVPEAEREQNRAAIEAWCQEWLGRTLPVTAEKDPAMIECWDDRAKQVKPDTGEFVESAADDSTDLCAAARKALELYP